MMTRIPAAALAAFFVVLFVQACAVLEWGSEQEFQARLIVNQTTVRFIEAADDPVDRAERVKAIASRVAEQVDRGMVASIADLEARARAAIDWQRLSMADQELLDVAISLAAEELMKRTGEGDVLSEADQVRIRTLLQWVSNAAGRFG